MRRSEYESYAVDLAESEVGGDILGFVYKDGRICRYNKATNDFVVSRKETGVKTLHKPTDGIKKYLREERMSRL